MRDRFPLLLVGGALLAGALGWFLMQGARRGGFADRLSTFRSEPDGSRALYLLLEETGVRVMRQQYDLSLIPPGQSLVLLGTLFSDERDPGRTSIDGSDGGVQEEDDDVSQAEFRERGLNAFFSPAITDAETARLLEHVVAGATLVYVPASHRDSKFLEDLGVTLGRGAESLGTRVLVPEQPTRYTRGVERVVVTVRAYLQLPPGAVPLLIDEKLEEPVAALLPHGQGRIIVVGAPELAMNRSLAVADNALFWHSLFSAVAGDGVVAFDEYHHGFTGDRALGEFAARYGLHFAVGQLLLGVIAWALSRTRFGRPRTPPDELRVGGTDALFATSRLYREGRHHAHAAQSIVRELATELAQKAGVSPRSEVVAIGLALDERGQQPLARALLTVHQLAQQASSDAHVEKVASLSALARRSLHQKESPP